MQYQEEQDYTKRFDFSLWVRLVKYAQPFYKKLLAIAITMMLCALCDVAFPMLTREAIDRFAGAGTTEGLGLLALKYVGLMFGLAGSVFTFVRLCGRVEVGMCHHIRQIGFKRLQELPFSFYDKTPVGFMIARMTTDTQRLGDTIGWGLIDLLWSAFYVIFSCVLMIRLNWQLALAVMVVIPAIALIAMYFQKRILTSYREVRKTNSKITGAFNEGIMGAKTTKTLVREEANTAEMEQLTDTMKRSAIHAAV
ncbi:MAG: ABC transporter ATP-binding protein, partial [Clostridiales bacterium]|nr:ABC transporter ATP-binding protein [Clostridiales bacterium]